MDGTRKWMLITAVIAGVVLCAAAVSALPSLSSTPLYTFRMEQVSSEMSFLPTERNNFTYTTEKGYNMQYAVETLCHSGGATPGVV